MTLSVLLLDIWVNFTRNGHQNSGIFVHQPLFRGFQPIKVIAILLKETYLRPRGTMTRHGGAVPLASSLVLPGSILAFSLG